MRAVFIMSLISAFLSLAAAAGFSAMTVVPRPDADRSRTIEVTISASFFFGWLVLALWARTRQRMEASAPVPGWLRVSLLVGNGLYSAGIILGVLA
jgi:hypothetical protein